eukprot:TRINITY_DN30694_c0_g1_i1.p1 TRINITY_DN30694_c0_g1~~TRINITY_DN30694_c0_g1_i1.p1  ORF type:complete len:363 (+),score=98.61 TRINITY_DN30694_c0_g1_i1:59-1147(+)
MSVSVQQWGRLGAKLYSFASKSGFLRCKVSNYGATLVSLEIRNGEGGYDEATLSFTDFDTFQKHSPFFGCTVGRYGNRIKHGKFELDGAAYKLETNNGDNHLHGGSDGFDKRIWEAEVLETESASGVQMTLQSKDGDSGYPGELTVRTWLLLGAHDELMFKWVATVDGKATVLNLTNHTYWNLAAWQRTGDDALSHVLQLDADRYVEVSGDAIPTGRLPAVTGTALDFSAPRVLRDGVDDDLVKPQRGYDQCLVFAGTEAGPQPSAEEPEWSKRLPKRGELKCPSTGYGFELFTSQPGCQVYTANYLDEGLAGSKMRNRGAVCLEAQNFPDAPNQPAFPISVLRPGEKYEHTTVHKFFAAPH